MDKHFCTCHVTDCPCNPNNPNNNDKNCDACIQKVLNLGEVPACIWYNVGKESTSQWSMENFAKFFLEKQEEQKNKAGG